jgi:hypothetical protein
LQPGEYAITVPVYRSATDALSLVNATQVTSYFILSSSSVVTVNVDLGMP